MWFFSDCGAVCESCYWLGGRWRVYMYILVHSKNLRVQTPESPGGYTVSRRGSQISDGGNRANLTRGELRKSF